MTIYRLLISILLSILVFANFTKSAVSYEKFINSNYGTEFWFTVPPALIESGNSNGNFVSIYINSDVDTKFTLNVPGKGFSKTGDVVAGIPYEINLEPHIAQAYIKTGLDPVFASEIYKNSGINIKSDFPVTVYVTVKYNTTGEGFLALPVNVLGREYLVSSYGDASIYYPVYNSFPSLTGVVAAYDGTEVSFTLGGNTQTQTSSGQKPGETIKKILNKGDVWMVSSKGREADLSGSKITANKPIAVVSGSHSANVPVVNKYSGYITEMELPTYAWGNLYHIPHIYNRKLSPVIRVFAKEANTQVFINGNYHSTLTKSGGIKNEGYLELRLNEVSISKVGTISSDKPIAVTLYNSGAEEDGLPEPPGDPFQMSLIPIENYQNEIFFSMPTQTVEQGYIYNYLNIIYQKDDSGNIPADLQIGKLTGNSYNYQKIPAQSILENIALPNSNYGVLVLKVNAQGKYSLLANDKFALYMYGFGTATSYGFPAGLKIQTTSSSDTEAPLVTWEIDCNGSVRGVAEDFPNDAIIRSNLAGSIYLSDESKNFVKEQFGTINPGVTGKIEWNLKVLDTQQDANAALLFWDAAGNFTKSNIYFSSTKTNLIPTYENYGSLKINSESESRKFQIVNLSDSVFRLEKIELKENTNGFTLQLPSLPIELNKNQNLEFTCLFTPSISGSFIDSIGFGDDCTFHYAGLVEATVGSPVIEVSDISFGDVTAGSKAKAYSSIRNTGVSELILTGYDEPDDSDFSIEFEKEFDSENPYTLLPGEQLTLAVNYNPSKIDNYSDSVVIFSDATTRDNVCLIKARSVEPGLEAGSYDWGRNRIFRTLFPEGPYPIQNANESISIRNTGNTEIIINGIEIVSELNSSAFEYNRQIFTNLKIQPGEKFDFKVKFRPEKIGEHLLRIKYLNNFGSSTITELKGFGTVPKLESQIVKFDTTEVENYDTPSIKRINIKNLGVDEWIYADTLTIYDFFTGIDNDISEIWAYFGDKGFKIDKQIIKFPFRLAPGESYILNSGFVPFTEGLSESKIDVISDGIDTANINLRGIGIDQALTFSGGLAESCIGFEKVINGIVKNNSPREIKIGSVTINDPEPEFTILSEGLQDGFTLPSGETKNIDILYKPVSTADKQIEVVLTDAKIPFIKKQATFYGKPIQYASDLVISPAMQTASIGDSVTQKYMFRTNSDLSNMELLELDITIKFEEHILKPILSTARIGKDLAGSFSLTKDELNNKPNSVRYIIKSMAGNEITKDADLFEISYLVYYPNDLSKYSDIEIEIKPIGNDCIIVNSSKARISINPVCGNDLRVINVNSSKYFLNSVSPNPSSGDFSEIKFGIGISAQTELRVFNSLGSEVTTPINGFLAKGEYAVLISTLDLNSGAYYYTLKSGPFYKTETFIINK